MFISRPVSSTFLKVTISQYNPVYFHTIKMSIPVDEIPIIPLMYRLKELQPPDSLGGDNEISIPSQKLNNKIATIRGDITKLAVDAIVNAANNSLLGGGGVDGAIHRAAGRGLVKECQTLGGCATGSAKITDAYELPCKNVIHAVGPVYKQWKSPTSAKVLAGCYTKGLELAAQNDCKSIAFSAISTGIYGYPSMEAASVALRAVKEFLEGENGDKIEKVVFCTFEMKDVIAYRDWIPKVFPPTDYDLGSKSDDWEEIEGGESSGNGEPAEKVEKTDVPGKSEKRATVDDLPDVPPEEPLVGERLAKKQKSTTDE